MERGQMVLVACKIEAGAFSGERVFRLTLADGVTEYAGVAPAQHLLTSRKEALARNEPTAGNPVDGFLTSYLISIDGSIATVEFPDGGVVPVNVSQVPYRISRVVKTEYVPV